MYSVKSFTFWFCDLPLEWGAWFYWESDNNRCCLKLLKGVFFLSFITTFFQVSTLSAPWHLSNYSILSTYLKNNLDCANYPFSCVDLVFHSLLTTPLYAETKEAGFCTHPAEKFIKMKLRATSAYLQPCRWSTFFFFKGKQNKASCKLFAVFQSIVYSCVNISSPWFASTLQHPWLQTAKQKNCLFPFSHTA